MAFDLPRTLTLPSGTRLTLRRGGEREGGSRGPPDGEEEESLFSDVIALFDHGEAILERGDKARLDVHDLVLRDFHVVRAVLAKAGLVEDAEVEIECHNCGAILVARPCRRIETGPWEDEEADDPELDRTAELGEPLDLRRGIDVSRFRQARTVTLRERTVRDAMPLFQALARDPLEIDEAFVAAMGIAAMGDVVDPKRIARVLSSCEDAAFTSVTDTFLAAHYPLRLASDVFCTKCKARNTVDAPYEREFELGAFARDDDDARGDGSEEHGEGSTAPEDRERPAELSALPELEDFVELAHRIADPLIAEIPGEKAELVVEDGTPAVDDGGEPLLGSYVPPPPKDAPVPTRAPLVTIYYRTFEKIEREEGRYDWEGELRETIEHELEHHVFYLRGDDPMDEQEHAEIDREVVRVVGRDEATRRTLAVFGLSIPDFFRRAWPLVLIAAAVLAITLAEGRCAGE